MSNPFSPQGTKGGLNEAASSHQHATGAAASQQNHTSDQDHALRHLKEDARLPQLVLPVGVTLLDGVQGCGEKCVKIKPRGLAVGRG